MKAFVWAITMTAIMMVFMISMMTDIVWDIIMATLMMIFII